MVQADGASPEEHADQACRERGDTGRKRPVIFSRRAALQRAANKFGISYGDTFVAAFNWILSAERDNLLCANEEYYLVRDSVTNCWPSANFDKFVSQAIQLWNNWS